MRYSFELNYNEADIAKMGIHNQASQYKDCSDMENTLNTRGYRLDNIDMLRGLVIVIMALDHVRDYFMAGTEQDPMTDPEVSAALFFTRWVSHFCAPVFVFLSGTSAGLMQARKSKLALGSFLFKRGCWLIIVEMLLISTAWTFSPGGIAQVQGLVLIPMQVIWVIGASMVALAAFQFLGARICLIIGLVIIAGHNTLDLFWPVTKIFDQDAPWWVALHGQASYAIGPVLLVFAYPLLPWIGVILLGFGATAIFEKIPEQRDKQLILSGLVFIALFILLRSADVYGDPNPWELQGDPIRTIIDFLNISKYPPSLLFVLITLGGAALLCAYASRIPTAIKKPLVTFGRAPFAFYVAHLYLIHALSVVLGVYQGFEVNQMLTIMFFYPKGFGISLFGVYAVWLGIVIALYPFSKWVVSVKMRRKDWWLSYV